MNLPLLIASGDPKVIFYLGGVAALGGAALGLFASGVILLLGVSEEKKAIARWQFGASGLIVAVAATAWIILVA